MAFLPKFANDIFISYARVDNMPPPGTDKGWVDLFKATLEIELSRLIGRAGVIRIWMDTRNLDGSYFFDEEIKRQIRQSGLFLALTSRGYLHPDSYCQKELDLFYRKAQSPPESLKVGTRSRLFNARLYNIPPGEWPRELAGTGGARLFDTRRSEFGDPSHIGSDIFEMQVKKLADEIFSLLSDYKEALAASPAPAPPLPEDAPTVFLASTVEGLGELRASVVERRQRSGAGGLKPTASGEAPAATGDSGAPLTPKPSERPAKTPAGIFICYRRSESSGHAGRLYDNLKHHFGAVRVFMDIDSLKPGDKFGQVITKTVSACAVFLLLIDRRWADLTDEEGKKRLDDPEDFVRLEISTALGQNVRIIPLRIRGAEMPRARELPEPLRDVAGLHAYDLSDVRWQDDMTRLIRMLEEYLPEPG